jgi:hypothetical protein
MEPVELSVIAGWNKLPIRIIYDFGDTGAFGSRKPRFDLVEGVGYIRGGFADFRPCRGIRPRKKERRSLNAGRTLVSRVFSHPAESCLSRTLGLLITCPSSMATDNSAENAVALALGGNAMKRVHSGTVKG